MRDNTEKQSPFVKEALKDNSCLVKNTVPPNDQNIPHSSVGAIRRWNRNAYKIFIAAWQLTAKWYWVSHEPLWNYTSDKFQALNITSLFPSFLQTFILVALLSLRCSAPQPLPTSWILRMLPIFNAPKPSSPRYTHFQELPFPFSKVEESTHHQSSTHSLMCMHI